MLRKTDYDQVPMKPQRVYQEMNNALERDTCYVTTIGLSQIAGSQFLKVYNPRNWINAAQAGRCCHNNGKCPRIFQRRQGRKSL